MFSFVSLSKTTNIKILMAFLPSLEARLDNSDGKSMSLAKLRRASNAADQTFEVVETSDYHSKIRQPISWTTATAAFVQSSWTHESWCFIFKPWSYRPNNQLPAKEECFDRDDAKVRFFAKQQLGELQSRLHWHTTPWHAACTVCDFSVLRTPECQVLRH